MNAAKEANHPLRLAASTPEPKQAQRPGIKRRLRLVMTDSDEPREIPVSRP